MKADDVITLVKFPEFRAQLDGVGVQLGDHGVVLGVERISGVELVHVRFGRHRFYLGLDNIALRAEPANAGVPTHVEIPMPAQAVRELATLAIDIALGAPLDRRSQPGYYTYVSRDTVREIRRVLESAGINWKQQHKDLRK